MGETRSRIHDECSKWRRSDVEAEGKEDSSTRHGVERHGQEISQIKKLPLLDLNSMSATQERANDHNVIHEFHVPVG